MYPLKFDPIFQKRLWGGRRLERLLSKAIPAYLSGEPVGESWELADLPPGTVQGDSAGAAADGSLSSVISNGPWLGKTLHQAMQDSAFGMGGSASYFPLLIKFLDAQQDLSVQVHPDKAYCQRHPGAHLKSEAWYILGAEPGAKVYKGLKPGVTKETFRAALQANERVAELLNAVKVRVGDCHYLESGTVHALGAGIVAAEVQTPSDTTFRVFDWNRLGPDGKPRALHVEQALECINFGKGLAEGEVVRSGVPGVTRLVACPYFTMDRLELNPGATTSLTEEATRIWIVLNGQAVIRGDGENQVAMARGDTVLLPPTMEAVVTAIAPLAVIEVRMP